MPEHGENAIHSDLPPALLLVGGLGKRLRSVVSDRPKPMADIAGRPFLEWLLLYLKAQGVRRAIFATGYMAEMIENHFGDGERLGLEIAYSVEDEPLGTGGALKLAAPKIAADRFFMINGDTLFAADLTEMLRFHQAKNADVSLALHRVEDNSRYGQVALYDERIVGFTEKPATPQASWINGGTFLIEKALLNEMPERQAFSFEQDVLPDWLDAHACFGLRTRAYFVDIGLPETLGQFEKDLPLRVRDGLFGEELPKKR